MPKLAKVINGKIFDRLSHIFYLDNVPLDSDVELIATYKVNLANFGHIEVQNESYFRYRELVEI